MADRENLQTEERALRFIADNEISTFEELGTFTSEHEKAFQSIVSQRTAHAERLTALTELVQLYEAFVPHREIKNNSKG